MPTAFELTNSGDESHLLGAELVEAVSDNRVDDALALIAKGAPPGWQDMFQTSTLHLAAINNSFDVLICLLRARAAVNVRDIVNTTPLHYAGMERTLHVLVPLRIEYSHARTRMEYLRRICD